MNTKENGKRLRKLRGDRSIQETAEALGISQAALSMYELGERNPRDNMKIKIAQFYGMDVGDIFFADSITSSNK